MNEKKEIFKTPNKNWIIAILSIVLILSIVGIGAKKASVWSYEHNSPYTKFTSKNPDADYKKYTADTKNLTYVIYYDPTCAGCKSVAKTVTEAATKAKQSSKNHFLFISLKRQGLKYFKNAGIKALPSVHVVKDGKVIYNYTGVDKAKLKTIISGKNPISGMNLNDMGA